MKQFITSTLFTATALAMQLDTNMPRDNLAEVMKLLQARQMLKPTVHPRAAAAVILGMLFGRIIGELDTQPVSDHEWNNAMITCFSGLFNSAATESQVYRANGQTSKVNG